MSFMDVIGVVSGVLGIIQFGMDNFPAPETSASTLNIAVGLDYAGGLQNAGGDVPSVMLWNEVGGFLGSSRKNGKVRDGSTATVQVDQGKNGQQASYGLLSAGNNAVCIAYISITWADGNKYAWLGDWGATCGGSWYYSNVFVSSSSYKPRCTWIDADGDLPETGMQIHFPEFKADADGVPTGKDLDYFCKTKAPFDLFRTANPNTISYFDPTNKQVVSSTPATQSRRRGLKSRAESAEGRLVVTSSADHSAASLCESKTSEGPDLANTSEKKFCRMADRTTFPLCAADVTGDCFNIDTKQLVIGGKAVRDVVYDAVLDWTTPGKTTTTTNTKRQYTGIVDWTTPGKSENIVVDPAAEPAQE